jgi:CheY-like chemotaxis protein
MNMGWNDEPAGGNAGASLGRACKLMIVDDEQAMIKVIGRVGLELGFKIRDVIDSRQATDAFVDFRPDILMLDLIMPGKDGIEVLDEVLAVDPDVRLVLMSGYGDAGLRLAQSVSNFHRCNGMTMLRKPFRVEALRQLLQQAAAERVGA